jgi:hypothetical protein
VKKVRVIPAPRQDDSRVVVLGAILDTDRVVFHAVIESAPDEIDFDPRREDRWEGFEMDNQWEGFHLTDDLDTAYTLGSGANCSSAYGPGRERATGLWHWEIYFEPAVPGRATKLTVRHIDGKVEISL